MQMNITLSRLSDLAQHVWRNQGFSSSQIGALGPAPHLPVRESLGSLPKSQILIRSTRHCPWESLLACLSSSWEAQVNAGIHTNCK